MDRTYNLNKKTVFRFQYCHLKLWLKEGFLLKFWFLGFRWAFVHDIVTNEIYWQCTIFGFQFGFKHEINPKHFEDMTE
jgi:hypothetical protein